MTGFDAERVAIDQCHQADAVDSADVMSSRRVPVVGVGAEPVHGREPALAIASAVVPLDAGVDAVAAVRGGPGEPFGGGGLAVSEHGMLRADGYGLGRDRVVAGVGARRGRRCRVG